MIFFFALVAVLTACEECPDCDHSSKSPGVRVGFYADRTLIVTEHRLDSIVDLLESSRALLDTAEQIDIDSLSALVDVLAEDSLSLTVLSADYRSGRLYMDRVSAVGGVSDHFYADTLVNRFLFLPLNMNANLSLFSFAFAGRTDTLALAYQEELVDDFEGVRLVATQIAIDEERSTFDSVRLVCSGGLCKNTNTIVEIYY